MYVYFSQIQHSLNYNHSIQLWLHFTYSSLQHFSMQLILSFNFYILSVLFCLCSRSSCQTCSNFVDRKAIPSSLFSMSVVSTAFFLEKISSFTLSSLIQLSSFLMVSLRLEMRSSLRVQVFTLRLLFISLSSFLNLWFSSLNIQYYFSIFLLGLYGCISVTVLLARQLEFSCASLLMFLEVLRFYSFLLRGEVLIYNKFLRVALIGKPALLTIRDSLVFGEIVDLFPGGEVLSNLRGETIRCSFITPICSGFDGLIVLSEDLQLLCLSKLNDSSSVVGRLWFGTTNSKEDAASIWKLIFLTVCLAGFQTKEEGFFRKKEWAVLLAVSGSFLWKEGTKLFLIRRHLSPKYYGRIQFDFILFFIFLLPLSRIFTEAFTKSSQEENLSFFVHFFVLAQIIHFNLVLVQFISYQTRTKYIFERWLSQKQEGKANYSGKQQKDSSSAVFWFEMGHLILLLLSSSCHRFLILLGMAKEGSKRPKRAQENCQTCNICMTRKLNCKTVSGSHQFCYHCLSKSTRRKGNCPLCCSDVRCVEYKKKIIQPDFLKVFYEDKYSMAQEISVPPRRHTYQSNLFHPAPTLALPFVAHLSCMPQLSFLCSTISINNDIYIILIFCTSKDDVTILDRNIYSIVLQ